VKTSIIIFRETDLFYNKSSDPVMRKIEVARLIASKIAYQWFGNILSPSWSHFWLYDGLATLFGEEAIVKVSTFINIATISMIYLKILHIIFVL